MEEREALVAAAYINSRRKINYQLERLDKCAEIVAGYISNPHHNMQDMTRFDLDSQGIEELKVFIKGQFNRSLGEIEEKLQALGVGPNKDTP